VIPPHPVAPGTDLYGEGTIDLDVRDSGKPVEGAIALAIIVPTLLFVAARSLLGFARWRIQRELWRRDVARLERR
jgi:hypothetical protein